MFLKVCHEETRISDVTYFLISLACYDYVFNFLQLQRINMISQKTWSSLDTTSNVSQMSYVIQRWTCSQFLDFPGHLIKNVIKLFLYPSLITGGSTHAVDSHPVTG